MRVNTSKISGVLHESFAAEHYTLRRYLPSEELEPLIEQYWFVDWDLPTNLEHIQRNLPDPQFNLVIEKNTMTLIGPIKTAYSYLMKGKGKIIGIKFTPGALIPALPEGAKFYVNAHPPISKLFPMCHVGALVSDLDGKSDIHCINRLNDFLQLLLPNHHDDSQREIVQKLFREIKLNPNILDVQALSQVSNVSIRQIQRLFARYIGISPKWLIRKYRLHRALEHLDISSTDLTNLALNLGYADQSHFTRDFKQIIGHPPKKYTSLAPSKVTHRADS
ncbi:helix-turn-helix domain-containing protein [Aestuariibacter sp. AA17]|uniref:Helix-turn-helix domain-containing protein n=1 Tax=Fluctibacter corallii TaxID=2984329 RepID=A0ABT3A8U8_9ALTE|nr:helix-turn-helix domain-containing protein [Aestuariibacter sp. AA17]MCV2885043.1 helix-turn-helix domain-containing protein [Aestuariibacter sp. AA17]